MNYESKDMSSYHTAMHTGNRINYGHAVEEYPHVNQKNVNHNETPFWFDDFRVLFAPDKFLQFWPLSAHLSLAEKYNAASRLIIYVGVFLSFYRKSALPFVITGLSLIMVVLSFRNNLMFFQNQEEMNNKYVMFDEIDVEKQPQGSSFSTDQYSKSGYRSNESMNNPVPFGTNLTTNSAGRPFIPQQDNHLERMYQHVSDMTLPQGLMMYPIPDQLKNVRPPTFNKTEFDRKWGLGDGVGFQSDRFLYPR